MRSATRTAAPPSFTLEDPMFNDARLLCPACALVAAALTLACSGESVLVPTERNSMLSAAMPSSSGANRGSETLSTGVGLNPTRRSPADVKDLLVPTPFFPFDNTPLSGETVKGHSILLRNPGTNAVRNFVKLDEVTPGHVYLYETVTFNNTQHCKTGGNVFPGGSPCWSAGPGNPIDGAIPEVEHWIAAFGATVAPPSGPIHFDINLSEDTPSETFTGPGLTNPQRAMIAIGIRDHGPELPDGHPYRWAQFNSILGACQGPPFFGPLPCRFVALQQHLPD
jgi:hypothetical protein